MLPTFTQSYQQISILSNPIIYEQTMQLENANNIQWSPKKNWKLVPREKEAGGKTHTFKY